MGTSARILAIDQVGILTLNWYNIYRMYLINLW